MESAYSPSARLRKWVGCLCQQRGERGQRGMNVKKICVDAGKGGGASHLTLDQDERRSHVSKPEAGKRNSRTLGMTG